MGKVGALIVGAVGRDFHNSNACFHDNPACEVTACTATQMPNIEQRGYSLQLAGSLYPHGIPVYPESELEQTIAVTPVNLIIDTPIDLRRVVKINRPSQRVRDELQEIGRLTLQDVLQEVVPSWDRRPASC